MISLANSVNDKLVRLRKCIGDIDSLERRECADKNQSDLLENDILDQWKNLKKKLQYEKNFKSGLDKRHKKSEEIQRERSRLFLSMTFTNM